MPHFDCMGQGTWICQFCTRVYPDSVKSEWVKFSKAGEPHGNKCPRCCGTGRPQEATLPAYRHSEDY